MQQNGEKVTDEFVKEYLCGQEINEEDYFGKKSYEKTEYLERVIETLLKLKFEL